jgi:hypothetical protein
METNMREDKNLNFEIVLTLDELVAAFRHFMHGSLTKKNEEKLLDALRSNSDDFEDLGLIIKRTASIMQEIYYDLTGDTSTLKSIKKKVEELSSILHISRSHPANALRRVATIRASYNEQALRKKKKAEV